MQTVGKYLMLFGLIFLALGLLIYFFGNKLNWFGQLPGDIRLERENFSFYMPIVSMLLLSLIISGILWLISKFF